MNSLREVVRANYVEESTIFVKSYSHKIRAIYLVWIRTGKIRNLVKAYPGSDQGFFVPSNPITKDGPKKNPHKKPDLNYAASQKLPVQPNTDPHP